MRETKQYWVSFDGPELDTAIEYFAYDAEDAAVLAVVDRMSDGGFVYVDIWVYDGREWHRFPACAPEYAEQIETASERVTLV